MIVGGGGIEVEEMKKSYSTSALPPGRFTYSAEDRCSTGLVPLVGTGTGPHAVPKLNNDPRLGWGPSMQNRMFRPPTLSKI